MRLNYGQSFHSLPEYEHMLYPRPCIGVLPADGLLPFASLMLVCNYGSGRFATTPELQFVVHYSEKIRKNCELSEIVLFLQL